MSDRGRVLKNSFRGTFTRNFVCELLNVRSPTTLRFSKITALVPFSTATLDYTHNGFGIFPYGAWSRFSRLCTLQREFCSRCNVKLLHPLEFNGISRAKPLASLSTFSKLAHFVGVAASQQTVVLGLGPFSRVLSSTAYNDALGSRVWRPRIHSGRIIDSPPFL